MQSFVTRGLVLREVDFGDYDKFIDILTPDRGLISVYCTGAKKYKSKNFSAAHVYTYAEFSVRVSRERLYLSEAKIINMFQGIRVSLDTLSFAAYICDIAESLAAGDENQSELLRLMLNTLYIAGEKTKPLLTVKAAFELRAISDAGFMPELDFCTKCKSDKDSTYFFDISDGSLMCDACYHKSGDAKEQKYDEAEGIYPFSKLFCIVSASTVKAMRYVTHSKQERVFSFSVDEDELDNFSQTCEKYVLYHLEKSFSSLELFKYSYANKK